MINPGPYSALNLCADGSMEAAALEAMIDGTMEALGPDVAVGGAFSVWTVPTVPDGWTLTSSGAGGYVEEAVGGGLRLVSDGTYVDVHQTVLTVGRPYRVQANVTEFTGTSLGINLGGTGLGITAAGLFDQVAICTASGVLAIKRGPTIDMTMTSIVVTDAETGAVAYTSENGADLSKQLDAYEGDQCLRVADSGEQDPIAYQRVQAVDGEIVQLLAAIRGDGTQSGSIRSGAEGDVWAAGTPEANAWYGAAYGLGKFVAVAQSGTSRAATSDDGVTWKPQSDAVAAAGIWNDVAYGDGLFVAVGDNLVMTSPDGETWTSRTPAAADGWESVTYGDGMWVAVASFGGGSRIMSSPDGTTWTARTSAETNGWNSVAWGNGLFVAVSDDGVTRVTTSPDGLTWTMRTAAALNDWNGVTYGQGLFVAVGDSGTDLVMTSPDGSTWTSRTTPAGTTTWRDVAASADLFVAVASTGTERVMTSPDGLTWTAQTPAEVNGWRAVVYGDVKFVSVSSAGTNRAMVAAGADVAVSTSSNTWQTFTAVVPAWTRGIYLCGSIGGTGYAEFDSIQLLEENVGTAAYATVGTAVPYKDLVDPYEADQSLAVLVGSAGTAKMTQDIFTIGRRYWIQCAAVGDGGAAAQVVTGGVTALTTAALGTDWETADLEITASTTLLELLPVSVTPGDLARFDAITIIDITGREKWFRTMQHLFPRARAWMLNRLFKLGQYIYGLTGLPADLQQFFDLVYLDLFPQTTRELPAWEKQFGLPETGLSDADKRDRLAAARTTLGGQDPSYIQDQIHAVGFTNVYIHEWWEPGSDPPVVRNPFTYLAETYNECGEPLAECGEPGMECGWVAAALGYHLVNKIFVAGLDYTVACGEPLAECGEPLAECGENNGVVFTSVGYDIPNDPDAWPFFLYFGAQTFPGVATIDAARQNEFEDLLLKLCPTQQWLGLLVNYV